MKPKSFEDKALHFHEIVTYSGRELTINYDFKSLNECGAGGGCP